MVELNSDPTGEAVKDKVTFSKTFICDWDNWLLNLFKKKKTIDVSSPNSIEDLEDK